MSTPSSARASATETESGPGMVRELAFETTRPSAVADGARLLAGFAERERDCYCVVRRRTDGDLPKTMVRSEPLHAFYRSAGYVEAGGSGRQRRRGEYLAQVELHGERVDPVVFLGRRVQSPQ